MKIGRLFTTSLKNIASVTVLLVLFSITEARAEDPACDMDTTQASYSAGETVTVSIFDISNPSPEPVAVEWKGFLEVPSFDPIGFINLGADSSLVLPTGFATDFGPTPLFVVDAGIPAGTYTLGCRVLDPVTGALLNGDLHSFDIVQ